MKLQFLAQTANLDSSIAPLVSRRPELRFVNHQSQISNIPVSRPSERIVPAVAGSFVGILEKLRGVVLALNHGILILDIAGRQISPAASLNRFPDRLALQRALFAS